MRRKHSDEARALADLLTRQCIEVNPKRCSWTVFDWRAKLLTEQGAMASAIAVLKQGLDVCHEGPGPERLLKALQKSRTRGPTDRTTTEEVDDGPRRRVYDPRRVHPRADVFSHPITSIWIG